MTGFYFTKCDSAFWSKIIVCPSKIGVCVWAQILKRVVFRFSWNFNTIIWPQYVIDFCHLENFRPPAVFRERKKRKMRRFFIIFFEMVNLYEIFYVMKVVGKILWGVFLIREFSDSRFGSYLRFSGNYVFQRGVPRQNWKLIFLVLFILRIWFLKKNL